MEIPDVTRPYGPDRESISNAILIGYRRGASIANLSYIYGVPREEIVKLLNQQGYSVDLPRPQRPARSLRQFFSLRSLRAK